MLVKIYSFFDASINQFNKSKSKAKENYDVKQRNHSSLFVYSLTGVSPGMGVIFIHKQCASVQHYVHTYSLGHTQTNTHAIQHCVCVRRTQSPRLTPSMRWGQIDFFGIFFFVNERAHEPTHKKRSMFVSTLAARARLRRIKCPHKRTRQYFMKFIFVRAKRWGNAHAWLWHELFFIAARPCDAAAGR